MVFVQNICSESEGDLRTAIAGNIKRINKETSAGTRPHLNNQVNKAQYDMVH